MNVPSSFELAHDIEFRNGGATSCVEVTWRGARLCDVDRDRRTPAIAGLARDVYTVMHLRRDPQQGHWNEPVRSVYEYAFEMEARRAIHAVARPVDLECDLLESNATHGLVAISGVNVWVTNVNMTKLSAARCVVHYGSLNARISPGFLYYSSCPPGRLTRERLCRIYIAAGMSAAVSVWRELVPRIDNLGIDFNAKILIDSLQYPRSDSIVVYVDVDHVEQVVELAKKVHLDTPGQTSVFAREQSAGVAWAREPLDSGQETSFGLHRAWAWAEWIVGVVEHEVPTSSRYAVLRDKLVEHGVDPCDVSQNIEPIGVGK